MDRQVTCGCVMRGQARQANAGFWISVRWGGVRYGEGIVSPALAGFWIFTPHGNAMPGAAGSRQVAQGYNNSGAVQGYAGFVNARYRLRTAE
jgi:hypothetical protein